MTIDQSGIDFIRGFEGFRAKVYRDVAGLPTIGYGHLIRSGESFPQGISEPDAVILLGKDVAPISLWVEVHAPLCNQNQHNALCSFGYNLGLGALETMLAHGCDQIPKQMLKWDCAHVNGSVQHVSGLTRRREAEVELFTS